MDYKAIIKEYERATNSHNFDNVEKLLTDDAVYWFAKNSYQGLKEIRSYFENSWNTIKEEVYTISDVVWISESDTSAACIYRYRWKGLHNGKMVEGSGRGTNVLRKENGVWKIVHEHLSAD